MLIVTDIIGFPGTDLERQELFAIKVCLSFKKSKNSLTTQQFNQLWSHSTENSFLNTAFICLISQDTVRYHTLLFKQGSRSTAEIYVGKKLWKKTSFILTILPVSKVNCFLEVRMSGTDIPSEGLQILIVHPHVCCSTPGSWLSSK